MSVIEKDRSNGVRPLVRTRELRPGWGTGRHGGPQGRAARPLAAPRLAPTTAVGARACRVERLVDAPEVATPPVAATGWRLTDRGIAIILATGLAIATAALVVVALTAVRVTGDDFVPANRLNQGVSSTQLDIASQLDITSSVHR